MKLSGIFLFTLSSLVASGAAVNLFSIASVPTLNPTLSPTAVVAASSFAASLQDSQDRRPPLVVFNDLETDLAPPSTHDGVLRRRLQKQKQEQNDGGGAAAVGYIIFLLCCGLPIFAWMCCCVFEPLIVLVLYLIGMSKPTDPQDLHFFGCPGAMFCIGTLKLPMLYSSKAIVAIAMIVELLILKGVGFLFVGLTAKSIGDPVARKEPWYILAAIYFASPYILQMLGPLEPPLGMFVFFCHLYSVVSVLRVICKDDAAMYFETQPVTPSLPTTVVAGNGPIVVPQMIVQQAKVAQQSQVAPIAASQMVMQQPQVVQQPHVVQQPQVMQPI